MRETTGERITRIAIGIAIVVASFAYAIRAKASALTLEVGNSVVMRGPVTGESVAKVQSELLVKCTATNRLYLVLDTPGGDVEAGNSLVETIKGLPCKVHTVTLFAASMGFHIVQNAGERLIVENGTLMSHRARGGLSGEMPGSFNVRAVFWLNLLRSMDETAAKRMGIRLDAYQNLIRDEYWVRGTQALKDKAVDKVITVRCGESLRGQHVEKMETLFGTLAVTWADCPLIQTPMNLDMAGVQKAERKSVKEYVDMLMNDKAGFVSRYVLTGEFRKFQ